MGAAQARQCFSHEKIGAVPPAQHMPEKAKMNSATFSSFAGQITSNEEMAQVGLLKWRVCRRENCERPPGRSPHTCERQGRSKASPHQPTHLPSAGDSQQRKGWHGARWVAQARQVTLVSVEGPQRVAAGWGPLQLVGTVDPASTSALLRNLAVTPLQATSKGSKRN